MKIRIPIKVYEIEKINNLFFVFAIGVYFLNLIIPGFRPGVFMSFVFVVYFLQAAGSGRFSHLSISEFILLVYIGMCIISVIWLPSSVYCPFYFETITSTILPMVLCFSNHIIDRERLYNYAFVSIFVCTLIGLVLFIWMPQFYINYLYNMGFAARATSAHARQGFSSFLGRTAMGTYSVFGMTICLEKYSDTKKNIWIALLYYMLFICILTSQRSAWVGAFIVFVIFLANLRKHSTKNSMIGHALIIVLGIGSALYLLNGSTFLQTQVFDKFTRFSYALSERSALWIAALKDRNLSKILFGNGFGTMGHRAMRISNTTIRDGNYAMILGESGVIGFVLFVSVILSICRKAIGYARESGHYTEMIMIFVIVFQAVGSNIFETQAIAPIFWISAGLIDIHKDVE